MENKEIDELLREAGFDPERVGQKMAIVAQIALTEEPEAGE